MYILLVRLYMHVISVIICIYTLLEITYLRASQCSISCWSSYKDASAKLSLTSDAHAHRHSHVCVYVYVHRASDTFIIYSIYSMFRTPLWSSGNVLDHRSLPPVFEYRRGHIWRLFHLWLITSVTLGGRSAHLANPVYKSGHKTSIIIYSMFIYH